MYNSRILQSLHAKWLRKRKTEFKPDIQDVSQRNINHVNWESEEKRMGIKNIISTQTFNPSKTGSQSEEANSPSRSHLGQNSGGHWPRIEKWPLSTPVKEVPHGVLNLESQSGLRRYGVKFSSPNPLSLLCLCVCLTAFRHFFF